MWRVRFFAWDTNLPISAVFKHSAQNAIGRQYITASRGAARVGSSPFFEEELHCFCVKIGYARVILNPCIITNAICWSLQIC